MDIQPGDVLRYRVSKHKGEGDLLVIRLTTRSAILEGTSRRRSLRKRVTVALDELEARAFLVRRGR